MAEKPAQAALPLVATGGRIDKHDRRKLLVVDGVVGFTSGIGITRIDAGASSGYERASAAPGQRGDREMRRAADPRLGKGELYVALLLAIADARRRVWLTYGYFVPDERMLQALEAAARRGVDVRLVLPGSGDAWAPFYAGRSRYGELLEAGVRIFERRDAPLPARAAADGIWTGVGSSESDWRNFVGNGEPDLIVFDRGFARRLEQLFRLDESASREVGLNEWRRRGLTERIEEWLARCWGRLP